MADPGIQGLAGEHDTLGLEFGASGITSSTWRAGWAFFWGENCMPSRSGSQMPQHLKVLKDAGLVIDRRAGNRRIYQLDPDGLGALRADLERFWGKALAAFKTAVEQPTEEDKDK